MERANGSAGPARSRAGGLRAAVSIIAVGALGLLVAHHAMASTTQHPAASHGSRTTPSPKDPHFSPPGAPLNPVPPTALRVCGRTDVRARYAGGGDGGQTHFGAVVLWNVSSTPCRLSGRPHLSATLEDDRPDRHAGPDSGQVRARVGVALPARTPSLRIARVSVTVANVDRTAAENRTLAGRDGTIFLEGVSLTG